MVIQLVGPLLIDKYVHCFHLSVLKDKALCFLLHYLVVYLQGLVAEEVYFLTLFLLQATFSVLEHRLIILVAIGDSKEALSVSDGLLSE